MIGIVKGEDWIALEFNPKLVGNKYNLHFIFKRRWGRETGEYGIAFATRSLCVFNGLEMRFIDYPAWIKRAIARKRKSSAD
jgi:hypothetical protein